MTGGSETAQHGGAPAGAAGWCCARSKGTQKAAGSSETIAASASMPPAEEATATGSNAAVGQKGAHVTARPSLAFVRKRTNGRGMQSCRFGRMLRGC
jgi:hypothetical protein